MDVTFSCPNCRQELVVDSTAAGSQVECPACNKPVEVPALDPNTARLVAAAASAAAPAALKGERHFSVPVHDGPAESLIQKPAPPLEAAARAGDKQLRIKCIKRTECVEVGKDHFDDVVSEFLAKVGEQNIISINTLSYTHMDIGTQRLLTDYGVMVVYKG